MKNVVLIGMPGSGKSCCGILAARELNMSFLDTDLVIQKLAGKSLQNIIDESGIDAFLAEEERALLTVNEENTVVATGGSAVFSDEGMRHLKENGTVVYLKVGYKEMKKRIDNLNTRGVVLKEGETLRGMYNERLPLYEKWAEETIECDGCTVEEAVAKLIKVIKEGGD